MFDLSAYALRFLEYLVLMVLFGVPLFGWYGSRRSTLADALAGWPLMGVLLVSAAVGTVLTGADIVFKTAGIMGMPVADVDRASLGWYLLETSAGRAAMARGALLVALMFVLGWHRRRGKVETAFPLAATLAGGALASLGHGTATRPLVRAWQARSGLLRALSIFLRQAAGSQRS
jgi:copper resistance protein D